MDGKQLEVWMSGCCVYAKLLADTKLQAIELLLCPPKLYAKEGRFKILNGRDKNWQRKRKAARSSDPAAFSVM
jgi:hypothetical protein